MPPNREVEVTIEVTRAANGNYNWTQLDGPKIEIPDMKSCKACGHKTFDAAFHNCGSCIWCCHCNICSQCNTLTNNNNKICSRCTFCQKCCSCIKCPSCSSGVGQDYRCKICGNGKSCCCHYQHGIHFVQRQIRFDRFVGKLCKEMPSKRLVSAEIEVGPMGYIGEGHISVDAALCDWHCSVVSDGSLPTGGFEINTHPASGNKWVQLVKEVCAALSKQHTTIVGQCGCHTHIDARDYSWADMAQLTTVIGCVELGMYSCLPITRATNRYCVLGAHAYLHRLHSRVFADLAIDKFDTRETTKAARQSILDILYSPGIKQCDVDSMKVGKSAGNRYRGFNLHSWLFRGTIEYRFPAGTIHATTIINWAAVLATLMDRVKEMDWQELMERIAPVYNKLVVKQPSSNIASYDAHLVKQSQQLLSSLLPNNLGEWLDARYDRFTIKGQQSENY